MLVVPQSEEANNDPPCKPLNANTSPVKVTRKGDLIHTQHRSGEEMTRKQKEETFKSVGAYMNTMCISSAMKEHQIVPGSYSSLDRSQTDRRMRQRRLCPSHSLITPLVSSATLSLIAVAAAFALATHSEMNRPVTSESLLQLYERELLPSLPPTRMSHASHHIIIVAPDSSNC